MLRKLSVQNYVLIDSLEIDFPEGLIIITGQTGAGKSILLGALSLLMGAKADAGAISEGADGCVVEAEFDIDRHDEALKSILEEADVDWEDGHVIVRRVVNKSGRSRSFVNDCPVPVTTLSALSSLLIDIHSQHQSLLLTDKHYQLSVLDAYAGDADVLSECKASWGHLQELSASLREVEERLAHLSAEKSYNESQFTRLDAAHLRDGELEELEAEQRQLANAEEIKQAFTGVQEMLAPSGDAESMSALLKESAKILSKVQSYVPEVESVIARLDSTRIELDDILDEVENQNSRVNVSSDRLEKVESRMALIYDLFTKYSCRTEAELIALREQYSQALFDSTALEDRKEELARSIASESKHLDEVATRLHEQRVSAAKNFSAEMLSSIRFLELDRSIFEVRISDAPISATGKDDVAFLFSSTGKNPVEIGKCASGGEISRIMLSLKALMAHFCDMPTMIFDEIDTGVSGSVADKMGSMICTMGKEMQVFAITHLPQVAAKGDAHFMVSREYDQQTDKSTSHITRLSDDERVMEVARMLSGSSVSDEAIANARKLLAD